MPIYNDYDQLGEPGEVHTGTAPEGQAWKLPPPPYAEFPEKPPIASTPGTNTPIIFGEDIGLNTKLRPLVFVPGIMGTELESYSVHQGRKYNVQQIWPPVNLATLATGDLDRLRGEQVRPATTSDNPLVSGAYDGLISFLTTELGYRLDENLFIFGYNWTQSNRISGRRMKGFIDAIFTTPRWKNTPEAERSVDVICHSMGGLVTRAAMRIWAAKVARTIYIASPHYGAPKAFGFLHPTIKKVPFAADLILRRATNFAGVHDTLDDAVRDLVRNIKSAFELLPDRFYFDRQASIADVGYLMDNPVKGVDETYKTHPASKLAPTPFVEEAMNFKEELTDTPPGRHYVLASNTETTFNHADISTELASNTPTGGYLETTGPTPNGDGTVPALSARGNSYYTDVHGSHADVPNMRYTFWHIALYLRETQ